MQTKIGSTPIRLDNMLFYLSLYANFSSSELIEGFAFGFELQYEGPRFSSDCKNLVSASELALEVGEKIRKELDLGRIAGPFDSIPLQNLRLSPISIVPKKMVVGA